jgi:hypothetical protein
MSENDTTPARQAALAAFKATTHRCAFPGCDVLVASRFCVRHRPSGEWAIAEQTRADVEQEQEREGER